MTRISLRAEANSCPARNWHNRDVGPHTVERLDRILDVKVSPATGAREEGMTEGFLGRSGGNPSIRFGYVEADWGKPTASLTKTVQQGGNPQYVGGLGFLAPCA